MYSKGITTLYPIENARLEDNLTREQLAKMIVMYAKGILKKQPNKNILCNSIKDIELADPTLQTYIIQACELGIMGVNSDNTSVLNEFNPLGIVTRAEFGTVLSRLLRGNTYA